MGEGTAVTGKGERVESVGLLLATGTGVDAATLSDGVTSTDVAVTGGLGPGNGRDDKHAASKVHRLIRLNRLTKPDMLIAD